MKTLHDRIAKVINTDAFRRTLEENGVEMIEFQCSWNQESGGKFDQLPAAFQQAILAGEEELSGVGDLIFA